MFVAACLVMTLVIEKCVQESLLLPAQLIAMVLLLLNLLLAYT